MMRLSRLLLALSATVFSIAGCTQTNFVDASGKRTGFRWYDPKPHLLVKRSTKTQAVLEATVEILPDMGHAQYATHRSGLGSGGFSVTTVNGVLTEFKRDQTDTGPSSLNKLSAAFKGFAAHQLKSREALDARRAASGENGEVESTEAAGTLKTNDISALSNFDSEAIVGKLHDGVNMAVAGPEAQHVRAVTQPLVVLSMYVKRAARDLFIYQSCLAEAGPERRGSCNLERKQALASVREVSDKIVLVRVVAWAHEDVIKQLEALQRHLDQIIKDLAPRRVPAKRKTTPAREKLGEVPITYELYAMRICDGRVVGLERIPPDQVCNLIECASSPQSYQDCRAFPLLKPDPVPPSGR